MKDRIPTYPGRVRLTPVSGQTNIYDMVRADEPVQEGTPLNKNTLLRDATAEALGLTADATVDEALGELKTLIDGRAKIETGSYTGTGTYGSSNPNSLTFGFEPKFVLVGRGWDESANTTWKSLYAIQGMNACEMGSGTETCIVTLSGNTMTWYTNISNSYAKFHQLNNSATTYYYVAIG